MGQAGMRNGMPIQLRKTPWYVVKIEIVVMYIVKFLTVPQFAEGNILVLKIDSVPAVYENL